jgi:hypothetical protein
MTISSNKSVKFSFIDWFLPLFYILAQYSYGFSSIGIIILIIYTVISLVSSSRLLIHKPLLIFVLFISFIQILNMLLYGNLNSEDFNNFLNPIIMLFILSTAMLKVNYNNLYKAYVVVGVIAMTILFYQWFMLVIYNIMPSPVTFFPVSTDGFYSWQSEYYRPSSLFTEPQAYASYMIPLLLMSLYKDKILFSFLIILSILFSGSSLGIIFLLVISVTYLLKSKSRWSLKFAVMFFISILVFIFISTDIFSSQAAKILSIDLANNIRLVKGFQIYSTFNDLQMLFGIGEGPNILEIYNSKNSSELLMKNIFDLGAYVTTISGLLISYGIFSLILFFWVIYKMYCYEDPTKRIFLIIILFASFGQTILFNGFFLLYYITYLGICNKSIFNKNYSVIVLNKNKI